MKITSVHHRPKLIDTGRICRVNECLNNGYKNRPLCLGHYRMVPDHLRAKMSRAIQSGDYDAIALAADEMVKFHNQGANVSHQMTEAENMNVFERALRVAEMIGELDQMTGAQTFGHDIKVLRELAHKLVEKIRGEE